MYRRSILSVVFIVLFALSANALELSASSAILYETSSGKILYQKDINTRREIASTTKIMTAVLTLEHSGLDDVVCIKPEYTGIEGTSIYLLPGEKVSVKTLLYGLMLQSGNDAAVALAGHISDDIDVFVKLMNEKAQALGMKDTCFKNPNGLPAEGHYSTAFDMAKLAAYAMEIPEFKEIVSTKFYTAEGKTFVNHNKLLKMSDRVDGIKTGFTKSAGRCLVSGAEEDGMRLVAVTLSAPNDWNDHLELYDYGFSAYEKRIFIEEGQIISGLPVIGGDVKTVKVSSADEVSAIISKYQNSDIDIKINLPRFVYAPVKEQQRLGEIFLFKDGQRILKSEIVSLDASEITDNKTLFGRIIDFFQSCFNICHFNIQNA